MQCLLLFLAGIGIMKAMASNSVDPNDNHCGSSSDLCFRDVNGNRIEFPSPPYVNGIEEPGMGFEHDYKQLE